MRVKTRFGPIVRFVSPVGSVQHKRSFVVVRPCPCAGCGGEMRPGDCCTKGPFPPLSDADARLSPNAMVCAVCRPWLSVVFPPPPVDCDPAWMVIA